MESYNIFESTHKDLRTDRGGKYSSSYSQEFCNVKGIKENQHETYSPLQNGVVERKNHVIVKMEKSHHS
jgi:hypothetical protein